MMRSTSRSVRYSRLRWPTVTFTEVGAAPRSREFSMETAPRPFILLQIKPLYEQLRSIKPWHKASVGLCQIVPFLAQSYSIDNETPSFRFHRCTVPGSTPPAVSGRGQAAGSRKLLFF